MGGGHGKGVLLLRVPGKIPNLMDALEGLQADTGNGVNMDHSSNVRSIHHEYI